MAECSSYKTVAIDAINAIRDITETVTMTQEAQ